MPGSRPRSRSNITVNPSAWSRMFSRPDHGRHGDVPGRPTARSRPAASPAAAGPAAAGAGSGRRGRWGCRTSAAARRRCRSSAAGCDARGRRALLGVEGGEPVGRRGGHAVGATCAAGSVPWADRTGGPCSGHPDGRRPGPRGPRRSWMSHRIALAGSPVRSAIRDRAAASASRWPLAGAADDPGDHAVAASISGTYSTRRRSDSQATTSNCARVRTVSAAGPRRPR